MNGLSLLAPLPEKHIKDALVVSSEKEFVLLGSENFDVLADVDVGAPVLIYVSHDDRSTVDYGGTFDGVVGDRLEMRRLEQAGYRPASTAGEKWGCYWKVKQLHELLQPKQLSDIKLASGKYLRGVPHGPILVAG
jgi:hypothetical protein